MKIVGLQKLTLLDYPGRVACTVFLGSCNFRCPFCHNGELLGNDTPAFMTEEEFFAFLEGRKKVLDGVCITGGEPTLSPELPEFMKKIKETGLPVKLDTNGYKPEVLRLVLENRLADYVAMDIKNSPGRYAGTVGLPKVELQKIEESIALLTSSDIDYEFRTTVSEQFHDEASVSDMIRWVLEASHGIAPKAFYIQPFVDRETCIEAGLSAPDDEKLKAFTGILAPFVKKAALRGKD